MTEKRCCGCGTIHPIEVLFLHHEDLWLCFGCSDSFEETEAEQEMIAKAELENWQIANNIDPYDYDN